MIMIEGRCLKCLLVVKKEVDEIRNALKSDKFEGIFLYGRRRVGKSKIIHESLKKYDGLVINYECKRASCMTNLNRLTKFLKIY